jgi:hypothetical protein
VIELPGELTEEAVAILRKASEKGYRVSMASERMIAAQLENNDPTYFTSNWDIVDWAYSKGWA